MELDFFNIGMKSEYGIKELKKIKEKKEYNPLLIEKAYEIIDSLNSIIKKDIEKVFCNQYQYENLARLIYGGKGKVIRETEELEKIKKRVSDISITEYTLDDIIKGREVSNQNIDTAIEIFRYLSDKCIEYSSLQHNTKF